MKTRDHPSIKDLKNLLVKTSNTSHSNLSQLLPTENNEILPCTELSFRKISSRQQQRSPAVRYFEFSPKKHGYNTNVDETLRQSSWFSVGSQVNFALVSDSSTPLSVNYLYPGSSIALCQEHLLCHCLQRLQSVAKKEQQELNSHILLFPVEHSLIKPQMLCCTSHLLTHYQ